MNREHFSKLLNEQQKRGKELLSLISNMHEGQNDFGDGMAMFGGEDLFYVPEDELDDFTNKFSSWKSYVLELLVAQFGRDDQYVYEWDTYVVTYVSKRKPILNQLKKNVNKALSLIDSFLERIDLRMETNSTSQLNDEIVKNKRVFVVHGHDTNVRNEVELFIRGIGYEPIILCKRADKGNTIIEKIEREAKDVCYAIILYTSCDLGKDKDAANLKPRARQNVVFEHGFMCAHLGRERVCALLENGVEQPGDLQGVIYKSLDASGAWKYQIADEMKAVGLDVDKNKINI